MCNKKVLNNKNVQYTKSLQIISVNIKKGVSSEKLSKKSLTKRLKLKRY